MMTMRLNNRAKRRMTLAISSRTILRVLEVTVLTNLIQKIVGKGSMKKTVNLKQVQMWTILSVEFRSWRRICKSRSISMLFLRMITMRNHLDQRVRSNPYLGRNQ